MKNTSIYSILLVFIIGGIISLPLIKIPISTSARGIVRASQENVSISAMVSGRVVQNHLEKKQPRN